MVVGLLVGATWFMPPGLSDRLLGSTARADDWVALFYHVHTQYSRDNHGLEPVKLTVQRALARADDVAKAMGLSGAITITDHNNHEAVADPAFRPTGVVQPIKGEEWSAKLGHAGVLGYSGDKPIGSLRPSEGLEGDKRIIALAQAQGGLVVVNHPWGKPHWKTEERLGVDAIEVWNGLIRKPSDEAALAWWHQLLTKGEQVAAIGGSDAHFLFMPIECPINFVFAKSNSPKDVLSAVKARRLLVLAGPTAPRVYLGADTNGDGQCDDAMVGDVLSIRHDRTVQFEVKVEKASPGCRLLLLDRDGTFFTGQVGVGPGWNDDVYRFERSFHANQRNFVRAEIHSEPSNALESLCNPIFLGE
jgi:hypothetical protein